MSDAKRYWIPGPLTNYGTTANGFAGEVLVVAAVDYGELERDLRDATIEADRVHKEHAEMIDSYEAKLEEYERRIDELQDEVDSSNQLIDKSARLAEAERLLRGWDNADAITIDRDFPQADVDAAEKLWDEMHAFFGFGATVSADEVK